MESKINGFTPIEMKIDIEVSRFVTFHYFEYPHKFVFEGEKHDFWELLYVDKGVVFVGTDDDRHLLRQGQIIFHKPNEFHTVECDGIISPALVVVSFVSESEAMKFFENRVLRITQRTKSLMSAIIQEAKKSYINDLGDPYFTKLLTREPKPFGSEQLIKNYFEAFLIELILQGGREETLLGTTQAQDRRIRFEVANAFLEKHLGDNITLDDLCDHCSMSKSLAQQIFKHETGSSVMQWYARLKIAKAKQYIREGKGNMTTIAYKLGFSSIHHFSRQFSKIEGKSPTEYAQSIISLTNKDRVLL